MSLTLQIPNEISLALKVPEKQQEPLLMIELAVSLYQGGFLSFGKARELAKMSKWEFHNELGKRRIERHYDLECFEEDLRYGYR
jgi:predicted HTH domain antitoxin